MKAVTRNTILLSIAVISFIMHFNHFRKELVSIHVWRQTQTQSTIDNFYGEDMNILNPRRNERGDGDGIFRMEFPLAQWLVAVAYKVIGNHLVISRLMMFLFGLLAVIGMYRLLKALFHHDLLALMGAWALNFSPSFYYYTINPMPDNLALCCAIWGLAFFFEWEAGRKSGKLIASGLMLAIAALTKLPFILYFVLPGYYFARELWKSSKEGKEWKHAMTFFLFVLLPAAWYAWVIPGWKGNMITRGMLDNQDSASLLLDYLQHNLVSTFPELLLNYGSLLFFLGGFFFLFRRRSYRDKRFGMFLSLSIVLVAYFLFELNAIAKIHDYYLFPFLPLIFILTAFGAYHLFTSKQVSFRILVVVALAVLPLTCALRMQVRWDEGAPGFNRDLLVHKEDLRGAVPQDALVVAGNDESHFIFFYYIGKKGWGFDRDQMSADQLDDMVRRGAMYLYSDSRRIEEDPGVAARLDSLVLERGTIRVFRLK